MSVTPQTWHHGLVARWWAEFNVDGPEIAYFQARIERHGQPALDGGCGTGRLLLPFLRAGLDVDGCDLSPDMLAHCQARAAREGLTPRLYAQAMHDLDLPRTYRTIVLCGSFGLGGTRADDVEALQRLYRHLEPGGMLALDYHLPYGNAATWRYWLKERRRELPTAWPVSGTRRRAADGSELELLVRLVDLDPLEQHWTSQMRARQWRGEHLIAEEEHTLQGNSYFKHELVLLLERAGFGDIHVYGGYTEAAATAADDVLVLLATK
jgi:SAM-dependent methyltransferase